MNEFVQCSPAVFDTLSSITVVKPPIALPKTQPCSSQQFSSLLNPSPATMLIFTFSINCDLDDLPVSVWVWAQPNPVCKLDDMATADGCRFRLCMSSLRGFVRSPYGLQPTLCGRVGMDGRFLVRKRRSFALMTG